MTSFWKYKVYADIGGGYSWWGPQMRMELSMTAIFGNLICCFFGNFRDSIRWRYAAPCRPVIDCKMSDLEWLWVAISCQNPFSAGASWLGAFDFQKRLR